MGRGRSGVFFLVVFVGLNPASFIADAEGETGRLGCRDTEIFAYNAWLQPLLRGYYCL